MLVLPLLPLVVGCKANRVQRLRRRNQHLKSSNAHNLIGIRASPAVTIFYVRVHLIHVVHGELPLLIVRNSCSTESSAFLSRDHLFLPFPLRQHRTQTNDTMIMIHQVYSQEGFDRVTNTEGMKDLLARHFPDIANQIPSNQSAFKPWGV